MASGRQEHIIEAARTADSSSPNLVDRSIAHSLISLAMQGEERLKLERERNDLHRRSLEGAQESSERADQRAKEMLSIAVGRAIDDLGEAHTHRWTQGDRDAAIEEMKIRERVARREGFEEGVREERDRWQGTVTKELIDAAIGAVDNGADPGRLWRLRDAVKAYRELMAKELR